MTFKEITTALLDYANVSSIASIHQAKRAINDACHWANRKHMFKLSESIVNITYPANTLYVGMDVVCDKDMLVPITVQLVGSATTYQGVPLEIIDYARLQGQRLKYYKTQSEYLENNLSEGNLSVNLDIYLKTVDPLKYQIFILDNGFGVYPTPTADVFLFIHFNEQVKDLVADDDENFLTKYCSDFIVTKALFSKFMLYLPKERIDVLSKEILVEEWESVKGWDQQLRNSENFFETL